MSRPAASALARAIPGQTQTASKVSARRLSSGTHTPDDSLSRRGSQSLHFASRRSSSNSSPAVPLALASLRQEFKTVRSLHTSPVFQNEAEERSASQRRREDIPASSWSRPPRPSQDAEEDVVPTYYLERKKQRASISERKEQEGGLMAELNAGILADGLAAGTRAREEKMPVEVRLPDGSVEHPSGFAPPTAETDFHPVAAKVASEEGVRQAWDEREFVGQLGAEPIEACAETEQVWIERKLKEDLALGENAGLTAVDALSAAGTDPSTLWVPPASLKADDPDGVVPEFYVGRKAAEGELGMMHDLHEGLITADMRHREEKIPVEVVLEDGTVAHPSGFEPPTAETEFHPMAAKSGEGSKMVWTDVLEAKREEA
ncbi:uncharacterized protein BXZ73DRAFT_99291 [Epithele typhae]|uniref:uncharacterized protein n=1 Tax=Epithele typhae TaxID=378194 RepID=UPI002007EBBB|nr:uncharacterized protein BXZ73DRAFT_99291 [Epithele typhae]KAH9939675.1 hypothetical protein BXZ73DRAFT_99291 [Epithele typhae]